MAENADQPCVLVVDDDEVIRRYVKAVLEPLGFRVEEASSGAIAIERTAEVRPTVVIVDHMMPGLTGVEVVKLLAGDSVKILMLTAVDDPGLEEEAVSAGASAFLTKPFSPGALVAEIEELLRP